MKILIINTDYESFLKNLYQKNHRLDKKSYQEQMQTRNATLFGSADFYSHNFNSIGHKAIDVHYNNVKLQSQWLRDNIKSKIIQWKLRKMIYSVLDNRVARKIITNIPVVDTASNFLELILKEQIAAFNPDIILNQDLVKVSASLLKRIKSDRCLLGGQIASPLPDDSVLKNYDVLISSLPNQVAKFKSLEIPAEYIKLAFDSRILSYMPEVEQDLPLTFVGSITSEHTNRVQLLEYLCKHTEIKIWGSLHGISKSSPIYSRYQGEAWGIDMYKIFKRSKIVLNNHIDLSENYANNMRLFEVTGSGSLLITDWKSNIDEIFMPDKEAVVYNNPEECLDKIQYYLRNEDKREKIALAGQARCLAEHTYRARAKELVRVFNKSLNQLGITFKEYNG